MVGPKSEKAQKVTTSPSLPGFAGNLCWWSWCVAGVFHVFRDNGKGGRAEPLCRGWRCSAARAGASRWSKRRKCPGGQGGWKGCGKGWEWRTCCVISCWRLWSIRCRAARGGTIQHGPSLWYGWQRRKRRSRLLWHRKWCRERKQVANLFGNSKDAWEGREIFAAPYADHWAFCDWQQWRGWRQHGRVWLWCGWRGSLWGIGPSTAWIGIRSRRSFCRNCRFSHQRWEPLIWRLLGELIVRCMAHLVSTVNRMSKLMTALRSKRTDSGRRLWRR